MPCPSRWAVHAQQARLPPTPPECPNGYQTPMSAVSDDMSAFYPSQSYPHSARSSRDLGDRFHLMPGFGAHAPLKQMTNVPEYHMNYPQPIPTHYQYAPIAAPLLPPIRVLEGVGHFGTQFVKPKEEKPTGGVAQHLDYEMDLMSSFVAEMVQQLVSQTDVPPTAQFRKYVSQILSSTRLPSSTIMLGLFYLQERMKIELEQRVDHSSSGTVYRMLTSCLLLGSKFLDDNTFQNRSWAEVSSISVIELNAMELSWLKDFNWEIHNVMYKADSGFFMWIDHWHRYEEKAQMAKVKELSNLSPINTNVIRHHPSRQPLTSPEGPIPPQYQQGTQYDTRWVYPLISDYSPPSAPHSGPVTPDFYGNNWHIGPTPDSFPRSVWNSGSASAYPAQRAHLSPYDATFYGSSYHTPCAWPGHGSACRCSNCGNCASSPEYYLGPSGYVMQPVVA